MKRAFFIRNNNNKMRNDYYFDDLDIENFFLDDQREPGVLPTRPGLVDTRPETLRETTKPRPNTLMGPVRMDADGKLKEKLKKFAKSKLAKTLVIGGAAAGLAIVAGPAIMSALAPLGPAMKGILAKQGIKAKGFGDVVKKFADTQVTGIDKDAKGAEKGKAILKGILGYFKAAKDRRAAGTATPLDEFALKTADNTIQKIADGTLSVESIALDETPTTTPGRTKEATETTEKKTGIDMKIVLIALVAVFFLTKK